MLLPPSQARHGITPDWSHDDRARQAFMRTVREGVIRKLSAGSRMVFENRVKPRFEKQAGRPFKSRQEARTEIVRRQIIWDRCGRDLVECWPHLVGRI